MKSPNSPSPSRYYFDSVLVAQTKLLTRTKPTRESQPQVLVLNSRLDKCHDRFLYPNSVTDSQQLNHSAAAAETPTCSSCCLRVEASEFRRRSRVQTADSAQCFALCEERRAIDLQVNASSPVGGNLVILALSLAEQTGGSLQGQQTLDSLNLSCRSANNWSFLRFDPELSTTTETTQPGRQYQRKPHAHYSRFTANQAPSILISSLDIQWDPVKRREFVSMTVQPSTRDQRRQQLVSSETLLVNEFYCHRAGKNGNSSTSNIGMEISSSLSASKELPSVRVHLLALINLESATQPPLSTKPIIIKQNGAQVIKNLADIPAESSIDYPISRTTLGAHNLTSASQQNKRAPTALTANKATPAPSLSSTTTIATKTSTNTATAPSIKPTRTSQNDPGSMPPPSSVSPAAAAEVISARMDSASGQQQSSVPDVVIGGARPVVSTIPATTTPAKVLELPRHSANTELDPSSPQTKIISPNFYLGAELGSLRVRLGSSSFMTFTAWSSFVILTYTLCLLIYLKTRRRTKASRKCSMDGHSKQLARNPDHRKGKDKQSGNAPKLQSDSSHLSRSGSEAHEASTVQHQQQQQQQLALNISEPFNLQMPPETRARLLTMLSSAKVASNANGSSSSSSKRQSANSSSSPSVTWKRELVGESLCDRETSVFEDANSLKMGAQSALQFDDHPQPGSSIPREALDCGDDETQTGPAQTTGAGGETIKTIRQQQQSGFTGAYGTIYVVRALRQAATLARSRFRNSRYRPNLRVIMESDLEYLQQSAASASSSSSSAATSSARSQPPDESPSEQEVPDSFIVDSSNHAQQQEQSTLLDFSDQVSPDLFDSLVQDAMSRECSHVVSKFYANNFNYNQTATLFSRPTTTAGTVRIEPIPASLQADNQQQQQVSRSRILRQVKQDGLYEEHYSEALMIGNSSAIPAANSADNTKDGYR